MTTKKAQQFRIRGLVQGAGFRPTVYRIALELGVTGSVFNDSEGVLVHLEGSPDKVDAFPEAMMAGKPPLARIDSIEPLPAEVKGYERFSIDATPQGGKVTTAITADASVCKACLEEIFNPKDRRWRYPFANCTHCGPRFTITRALPYDRPQTSMAAFPLCDACREEYEDPLDRRFHAQPIACPTCGPSLTWTDAQGQPLLGDPITEMMKAIDAGKIVAMKGLGGFHLVCDARNPDAVATLRARKGRDEKPLAVMMANLASVETLATLSETEKTLLESPAHPIVLVTLKADAPRWRGINDGLESLGVMLPYTPLHALLFHTKAGEPTGMDWLNVPQDLALVMTSANPGGEPLVISNEEALERLGSMVDYFLFHNRDIVIRCDDSVVRVMEDQPVFIRRARGYAPEAIRSETPHEGNLTIGALGPYLKNTACLLHGSDAFMSQHIGSLNNRATLRMLEESVAHLEAIFELTPDAYTCDQHPDFMSTQWAQALSIKTHRPLVPIYHHAAHIGAIMAELSRSEPTFGLALDGVGLGPNQGIWGGEALLVEPTGFTRVGHIEELALPGGDKAAKEPWRMGAAILALAGEKDQIKTRFANEPFAQPMAQLIDNPRLTPKTSSLGRWFDGAAALLGYCYRQHDEATAAMLLEAGAHRAREKATNPQEGLPVALEITSNGTLILKGLAKALCDATSGEFDRDFVAMKFENTLSQLLAQWAIALRARLVDNHKIDPENTLVVAGGGCCLNKTLTRTLRQTLGEASLTYRGAQKVPPGDGGLSLGQAWLARLTLEAEQTSFEYDGEAFS